MNKMCGCRDICCLCSCLEIGTIPSNCSSFCVVHKLHWKMVYFSLALRSRLLS